MYETKEVLEKVILVAVSTGKEEDAAESLDELEELAKTAGAQVAGRVIQNLEHVNNATYGKQRQRQLSVMMNCLRHNIKIWKMN